MCWARDVAQAVPSTEGFVLRTVAPAACWTEYRVRQAISGASIALRLWAGSMIHLQTELWWRLAVSRLRRAFRDRMSIAGLAWAILKRSFGKTDTDWAFRRRSRCTTNGHGLDVDMPVPILGAAAQR